MKYKDLVIMLEHLNTLHEGERAGAFSPARREDKGFLCGSHVDRECQELGVHCSTCPLSVDDIRDVDLPTMINKLRALALVEG